jgi:hypothetical protein
MTILILRLLGSPGERREKQQVNAQDQKRGRQQYFHIHSRCGTLDLHLKSNII